MTQPAVEDNFNIQPAWYIHLWFPALELAWDYVNRAKLTSKHTASHIMINLTNALFDCSPTAYHPASVKLDVFSAMSEWSGYYC